MSKNNNSKNKLLPVNVNKTFEGKYLIIKPITHNELNDRYLSWVNNKEINRYLEVRYKKQNIRNLINYINYLRKKNNCDLFAVFTRENLEHIGNCTITSYNSNGHGCAEFGVMVGNSDAKKMGLGTEIHIILLEYFFSDPEIFRMNAGMCSENIKSWKTLESLGYIREGVIRKNVLLADGKRSDSYLYGIFREEWLLRRKKFKIFTDSVVINDL